MHHLRLPCDNQNIRPLIVCIFCTRHEYNFKTVFSVNRSYILYSFRKDIPYERRGNIGTIFSHSLTSDEIPQDSRNVLTSLHFHLSIIKGVVVVVIVW